MTEEQFHPTEDQQNAIDIAIKVARILLRNPRVSPLQIIGLGHAIIALERFPDITSGVHVEFGVSLTDGDSDFRETIYISFLIVESLFELSRGGSVYEKSVGSDRYSNPGWVIDIYDSYNRRIECELWEIEHSVKELLTLGANIQVSDESEIDFGVLDDDD